MKTGRTVSRGEQDFINGVVEAIIKRDLSNKHYLINDGGLIKYLVYPVEQKIANIRRQDGTIIPILCIFGPELIEDLHLKSGNDDLTIPWLRKAIKKVIAHGKLKSAEIYGKLS